MKKIEGMQQIKVNIACGDSFVEEWLNFDYAPYSRVVKKANLLSKLPVANEKASVVYSSHFLEHVPKELAAGF
jgi:predicted SAM-dependent methyltransferase